MKMIDNRSGFEVLDRRECLRLLAGEDVGRVGVVEAGSPLVLPVNFGMDGDIRVEIDELPEKGHAIQLAVYIDMAATRAEETKIVRINTNEAA